MYSEEKMIYLDEKEYKDKEKSVFQYYRFNNRYSVDKAKELTKIEMKKYSKKSKKQQ